MPPVATGVVFVSVTVMTASAFETLVTVIEPEKVAPVALGIPAPVGLPIISPALAGTATAPTAASISTAIAATLGARDVTS